MFYDSYYPTEIVQYGEQPMYVILGRSTSSTYTAKHVYTPVKSVCRSSKNFESSAGGKTSLQFIWPVIQVISWAWILSN